MKLRDLSGKVYGKLTVLGLGYMQKAKNGTKSFWKCLCNCGKETIVFRSKLISGHTTSCGCMSSRKTVGLRSKVHGLSHSREHNKWCSMLARVYNKNVLSYKHYGGRGIGVCERWNNFENFLEDMGKCPDGMTLERLDNNGNYEPGNCAWKSRMDQANNKRNNIFIEYIGKRQTMTQWARDLNLKFPTLWARINKLGWPLERALGS